MFAGYKQSFDGEPTRRACEVVDGERNLLMVLPSVLANAVPNVVDALAKLRDRLEPSDRAVELSGAGEVPVGKVNEDTGQTHWVPWGDFAGEYDVSIG